MTKAEARDLFRIDESEIHLETEGAFLRGRFRAICQTLKAHSTTVTHVEDDETNHMENTTPKRMTGQSTTTSTMMDDAIERLNEAFIVLSCVPESTCEWDKLPHKKLALLLRTQLLFYDTFASTFQSIPYDAYGTSGQYRYVAAALVYIYIYIVYRSHL
jgi:hypothetical protein